MRRYASDKNMSATDTKNMSWIISYDIARTIIWKQDLKIKTCLVQTN